jgi:hypothetical protein
METASSSDMNVTFFLDEVQFYRISVKGFLDWASYELTRGSRGESLGWGRRSMFVAISELFFRPYFGLIDDQKLFSGIGLSPPSISAMVPVLWKTGRS